MKQLKILFVLQAPWGAGLGASKVHYDLKKEYEKLGHTVDYFDLDKMYPKGQTTWSKVLGPMYTDQVFKFLKKNAHKYDVIDANYACIPFAKKTYNFEGVVVFRSHGLSPLYRQLEYSGSYKRMEGIPASRTSFKTTLGNIYRLLQKNETEYELYNSIVHADIVHVLNEAEYNYMIDYGIPKEKIALVSNGIPDAQLEVDKDRVIGEENIEVSFIGSWTNRKGIKDLNGILNEVEKRKAVTKINLLGGGREQSIVQSYFETQYHSILVILPSFTQEELPLLLQKIKVGLFPSYAEGFGLAIIEQLALGIPVVAYNTPGPADILEPIDKSLLVPAGDITAFGQKVASIIELSDREYERLSDKCKQRANDFKMSSIARQFLSIYKNALTRLSSI